jgi:Tetracyclin repressor-like, C-terminal domain
VAEQAAAEPDKSSSAILQIAASGRYPLMSKLTGTGPGGRLSADETFDLGLNCLLDGVGALVAGVRHD